MSDFSLRQDEVPTPTNGKPYYCVKCKLGFGEYMACELPDCKLESHASAEMRQLFVAAADEDIQVTK